MRPLCTLLIATAPNVAIWAMQAGDLLSAAGWLGAAMVAAWMVERRARGDNSRDTTHN